MFKIIITFALMVVFTDTPNLDCGVSNDYNVCGCYNVTTEKIYLSNHCSDYEYWFYYEMGRAIFYQDKQAGMIIKGYEPLHNYSSYYTKDELLNVILCDYFAEFMLNSKEFSVKYPCLWIYFRDTISELADLIYSQ